MARKFLTDEDVEAEISRLENSEYVRLARKEKQVKDARRQRMYTLRMYEKKGKALAEAGVTMESLCALELEGEKV